MAVEQVPKAVLITGGARRIGAAIGRDLARHGWAVAVHHRHSGRDAEALVDEIVAGGGSAVALQADLSVEAEVAGLIDAAAGALGAIGCLINNASVFEGDTIVGRDPRVLGNAHGGQSAGAGRADAVLCRGASARSIRMHHQHAGPAGCGT